MKKIFGALGGLLCCISFTACNQTNSSSTTSTLPIPKVDVLEQYEQSFNLQTVIQTKDEESTITQTYETFVGEDYYTFLSYAENLSDITRSLYYEKGENNEVIRKTISIQNTIIDTVQSDSSWLTSSYSNPLGYFDLEIKEEGDYDLLDATSMANVKKWNGMISGQLTGTLTPTQAVFTLENDRLTYHSTYSSNGITLTLDSTFASKDDEIVKKIKVYDETTDSQNLDALFLKLKANNYTVEIQEDENLIETVFVDENQIYSRNQQNNMGYLQNESGYVSLLVNQQETLVTLNAEFSDPFTSLLANFNLSGCVFQKQNDTFSVYSDVGNVLDAFQLIQVKDYLTNNHFTLTYTDNSLTLSNQPIMTDTTYTVTFKDIGSTSIPVDLTNYSTKNSWADESEELAQTITELLGSLDVLPYFDTGHGWNYFDYSEGEYLEILSEGDESIGGMPDNESAQLKLDYAQILSDAGYRKMTSDEIENLSWYYCEDPDAQQVYDLGNGFACEVYDSYVDSWGYGIGLYIQKIDL